MNTKKQCIPFSFYDTTGMERHLQRMAEKGWYLDSIGTFFWTYRREPLHPIRYSVIYYPSASAFEPEPSDGQQTLEEFCQHAGWTCVASNAQLLIFANEREDPIPIHTDPAVELESLERMAKRTTWPWYLMTAVLLFQLCTFVFFNRHDLIGFASSSTTLGCSVLLCLVLLYFLAEIITWHRWHRRAKAALEQEEDLPPTRGHHRLITAVLAVFAVSTLYQLIVSRIPGLRTTLLLLIVGYTLLFAVMEGIRRVLKKKKVSAEKNRAAVIAADVVMCLILFGAISWGSIHAVSQRSFEVETLPLTVQMLTGEETPGYRRSHDGDATFLLSKENFVEHPPYDQAGEARDLSYTCLDVRWSPLYKPVLHQLLHLYDNYGSYQEREEADHPLYRYEPMDPAPWGVETAYQLYAYGEAKSKYLLCKADRIVSLDAGWFLTEVQMDTVGTTLFP